MSQHVCDAEFDWCPVDARAGDSYKPRVKDLSPTQFAVGKTEIGFRAGRKLAKAPDKLHDYPRTRPIPVVVQAYRRQSASHNP